MSKLDDLSSGALGFFWPVAGPIDVDGQEPERGFLRSAEGWINLEVLVEDPFPDDEAPFSPFARPEALVGVTPDDCVLLLQIGGTSGTRRSGPRASTRTYRALTVIGNVQLSRLLGPDVHAASVSFLGLGRWSGLSAIRESHVTGPASRLRSWQIHLESDPELSQPLAGGRELTVAADWQVSGSEDSRTARAPVSLGCRSDRPIAIDQLLRPLFHVQNLVGIAFGGFVPAISGRARLHLQPDADRGESHPSLWNGQMMVPPAGAPVPDMGRTFPLFDLEHVAGVAGLVRWVELCEEHPRAISPVTAPYRVGTTSSALTLMDTAAGIEYWVKANRPAEWAEGKSYALQLAGCCGAQFENWVGQPEAWAETFRRTNNLLKHEPTFRPQPDELRELASSGHFLLGAALLDRAAGTEEPSRAIFGHHQLRDLGERLRHRY